MLAAVVLLALLACAHTARHVAQDDLDIDSGAEDDELFARFQAAFQRNYSASEHPERRAAFMV